MTTIDKALSLLACFTSDQSSHKLTDLARASGMNKAGVFRYLSGMVRAGVLEQDAETRRYRLGPEVIRLAQVRDSSIPVRSWMRRLLSDITDQTGETCHAALTSQGRLFTYMVNDSPKSLQVRISPGMHLPYHATASGQAFLAFADADFVMAQLSEPLSAFTSGTVTDPAVLHDRLRHFRQQGYSLSEGGVDSDVISVATPFFDASAMPAGTIAIQAPAARMTDAIAQTSGALLCALAQQATQHYGGVLPADFPAHQSPQTSSPQTFLPETSSPETLS
ncbi:MAG: IclR family transcriptional regulator [Candidatus Puniceispirillaceae bacterium]